MPYPWGDTTIRLCACKKKGSCAWISCNLARYLVAPLLSKWMVTPNSSVSDMYFRVPEQGSVRDKYNHFNPRCARGEGERDQGPTWSG